MRDLFSEKLWSLVNDRLCEQFSVGYFNSKHHQKDQRYR